MSPERVFSLIKNIKLCVCDTVCAVLFYYQERLLYGFTAMQHCHAMYQIITQTHARCIHSLSWTIELRYFPSYWKNYNDYNNNSCCLLQCFQQYIYNLKLFYSHLINKVIFYSLKLLRIKTLMDLMTFEAPTKILFSKIIYVAMHRGKPIHNIILYSKLIFLGEI